MTDPLGSFSSRAARVSSVPAVKIVARFRGVTSRGPTVIVLNVYGFVHGGFAYVFEYATTGTWIAREKPVFARSIRSVRFPNLA